MEVIISKWGIVIDAGIIPEENTLKTFLRNVNFIILDYNIYDKFFSRTIIWGLLYNL